MQEVAETNKNVAEKVDKIEDYGEKLEGAKKDMPHAENQRTADLENVGKIIHKIPEQNREERIVIANWLKQQDENFVSMIAKYNHQLTAYKTDEYKEQLRQNEDTLGENRLNILYGKDEPSPKWLKEHNITPEHEIYVKDDKHHFRRLTPDYIEEKLGERGKVQFTFNQSTHGDNYLWVKKGKSSWAPLKKFDSEEEMNAYKEAHSEEDLLKLYEDQTKVEKRDIKPEERKGEDYRNGKNITAEDFTETFGFRGVQFGNYESNDKRQSELNNAYDSLLDLAHILNIPPKAISLEGNLGIAFGARGSGSAAAHYEPDKKNNKHYKRFRRRCYRTRVVSRFG